MADERVVIKIDTTYDGSGARKAKRDIRDLDKQGKAFSSGKNLQNIANKNAQAIQQSTNRMKRSFDFFDSAVKMSGNVLKKFVTSSLKLVTAEMALLGAAMVGVHALFVAGRFLVKAYNGAMQVLAGGAAAAAIAISTAAAAIREQQAAMFAYRGRGAGEFGSGLNQARVAMRGLQMDSSLAGLGVASLNKAYAAMSKTMTTPQINASTSMFKALMDFGAAGQDPAAAAEKVGAMIAALSDSKKSLSDVSAAAKEIGPEMEDALKKANVKTKEQLRKLIMSGELAKIGGVAGQFDAVNQTLIGQAKTFFNLIRGQFADFGQTFLEPAKVAMQEIFRIIQRDINRVMVSISGFGSGRFMDGLVNTIDRVSNWTADLVTKWLPRTEGMWENLAGWWERFTNGWKRMVDSLRPMIDGARVIEKAFSPIWQAIKEGGVDNLRVMREELMMNEETFVELGNRIADLIRAVSKFSQDLKKAIVDILPFINDLISGLTTVFKMLSSTLTKFAGGGLLASLAPLMFMFLGGRQMSQTKGGFMGTGMKNMTVNATNVNVNGVGMGGPTGQASATGTAGTAGSNASAKFSSGQKKLTLSQVQAMTPAQRGGQNAFTYWQNQNSNIATGQTAQANAAQAIRTRRSFLNSMMPAQNQIGPGQAQGFSTTRRGFAAMRDFARQQRTQSAGGAAIFGNEQMGIRGINNTMSARLGAGMGLAALSQVAPEEMRGALSLGSMVGMYSPVAGLAVAGLGGAMTANNGGLGALSGAGGGAALGMMVGGPAGAAIGAALGGITGAIMGSVNKMKAQAKAAKEAVNTSIGGMLADVATAQSMSISQNRMILESGGSLAGVGRVGGAGAAMGRLASLRKLSSPVAALGQTDKTNWMGLIAGGAATGATIGGAAGSLAGGVGAIPGALAGALMGGVSGLVTGVIDKAVGEVFGRDSEVSKAQQQFLENIYANQKQFGLTISKEQFDAMLKDKDAAVKEIDNKVKITEKVYGKLDTIYNERLTALAEMSGKSAAEVEVLAQQLGVNLYDATVEFTQVAKDLGILMMKNADQMKSSYQNALLRSTDFIREEIKAKEAQYVVDEKARVLRDKFEAGTLSDLDVQNYIEQLPADLTALYGGDALAAFKAYSGGFGANGAAFGEGGALRGMGGVFAKAGMGTAISNARNELITTGTNQIIGALGEGDFTANRMDITKRLAGMSDDELIKTLEFLASGKTPGMFTTPGQDPVMQFLKAANFEGLDINKINTASVDQMVGNMDDVAEKMGISIGEFKLAVDGFTDLGKDIFGPEGAGPAWMREMPPWWKDQDTRSPRGGGIGDTTGSRLSQTMARHAAMNAQLTGKRTITSAFRTWGLGSPSSDHVTGRAYDLVGQNLGAYSKLVHANGGFAEFHGAGGGRHLHVVPGPGPYGDTTVPSFFTPPASQSRSSGTSIMNSITINAAPGQSPDEIARAVIKKIDERERNYRERA